MNRKKTFCFILPSFFFERKGGAEIQCYYIANELIKHGYKVHYIRETNSFFRGVENYQDIHLHSIYVNKMINKTFAIRQLWKGYFLNKVMQQINADFWYIRSNDAYLPLAEKFAKKNGRKIIWACAHDYKTQKNHWKKRYGNSIQNKILNTLKNVIIIFQTNYQRETFERNYGIGGKVIYNSHPVPEKIKHEKQRNVVWIGNFKNFKRPELFLELVKTMSDSNYNFLMIGKNTDKFYYKLIEEIKRECKNFKYFGELSFQKVHEVLSNSKLLINTSMAEGFSNTFIEAWLRGVPILSLEVDPDNLIKEQNLGKVCSNLHSLEMSIVELMENTSYYDDISRSVRKFAIENFNIENATQELINTLNSN